MNAAPVQGHSLARLLDGLADLPRDVEISDLTQDGRAARPGCAFLAVRGSAGGERARGQRARPPGADGGHVGGGTPGELQRLGK